MFIVKNKKKRERDLGTYKEAHLNYPQSHRPDLMNIAILMFVFQLFFLCTVYMFVLKNRITKIDYLRRFLNTLTRNLVQSLRFIILVCLYRVKGSTMVPL